MSYFTTFIIVFLLLAAITIVTAYIITIIYHILKPKPKLKGTSKHYTLSQMKEIK